MRMNDKDIEWWSQVWRIIQANMPLLSGITLATLIGFIREKREGNSVWQSLGEAAMCGLLSVAAIRSLEWVFMYFELPPTWQSLAEFCGAAVGFLGTKKLSRIADAFFLFIKNKFGVNN